MTLKYTALGLIIFAVIIIILGIVKIHTYPGKIAVARRHPQAKAIEVTSLLGLIVFPLWMAALVWAYSNAIVGQLYASDLDGAGDDSTDADESEAPPPQPAADADD
jgi:hypothetical protein